MIDIGTIEREILDLEKRDTTFATVERLAWLYIVRDHMNKQRESSRTSTFAGSEFSEACSGVPMDSLMNILSEHFEAIKAIYPREYDSIIQKIKGLSSS